VGEVEMEDVTKARFVGVADNLLKAHLDANDRSGGPGDRPQGHPLSLAPASRSVDTIKLIARLDEAHYEAERDF